MPEYQASQVLENSNSTLEELLNALEDMAVQYGYISAMAGHGLRENIETDLVRTLCLIKIIKLRIHKKNNYPKNPMATKKLLNVDHFDQNDNDEDLFGAGWRQCCMTSNAMAANYILKKHGLESLSEAAKRLGYDEGESYYGRILNTYGDSADHSANTKALAELGLESYFSTSLGIDHAIASIDADMPMPAGFIYKKDGHIVCVTGYDQNTQELIVNDPYGIREDGQDFYRAIGGYSGKNDHYTFDLIRDVWANPTDGWGRIFTKVNGKPTGL